jgi:hypothetical protein
VGTGNADIRTVGRIHLMVGRQTKRRDALRPELAARLANRRDARTLRLLVAEFESLTHADWDDIDALAEVADAANRLNVSDEVRGALRAHPPIRAAIETNASAPVVRAFLTRA